MSAVLLSLIFGSITGYNFSRQQNIIWNFGGSHYGGQNLSPEDCVLHSSLVAETMTSGRVQNVPFSNLTALLHPSRMGNTLELAHIPKTGGTAVEIAGARGGVPFSYCHFHPKFIPGFVSATTGGKNLPQCPVNPPGITQGMKDDDRIYNKYHAPPCFFQKSFYDNAGIFAIVRNPYDRIISEYYYNAHLKQKINPTHKEKNEWIHQILTPMRKLRKWRNRWLCSKQMPRAYFAHGGHFIPQYDFVFGAASGYEDRVVHHVLKFEDPDMHSKFSQLMHVYGLDRVVLPPIHRNKRDNLAHLNPSSGNSSTWSRRSPKWLSPENIKLIQHVYEDDFKVFGYPMEIA